MSPAVGNAPPPRTLARVLSGLSPPAFRCRRSSYPYLSARSSANAVSHCSSDRRSSQTQSASPTSASPAVVPRPAPPHWPRTSPEPARHYQTRTADRSYGAPNYPEKASSSRSDTPTYASDSAHPPPVCPPRSPARATPGTPPPLPPQPAP